MRGLPGVLLTVVGIVVLGLAAWFLGGRLPAHRVIPPPPPAARPPAWDLLELVRADPRRPEEHRVGTHLAWNETRTVLTVRVPDRVAYPVTIPPDAVLDVGYTIQSIAMMAQVDRLADPTRIVVRFRDADGAAHVVHERTVDLAARTADRRWFDERIDLGPFAGRAGTLELAAEHAGDGPARGHTTAHFATPRVLRPPGPDDVSLLFVTIDCLRADHVSAYGYDRPTTPALDRLAAEGVRFAHAFTNAPMTVPSLPQMFTSSLFPAAAQPSLVSALAAAGIPNAAVVNNVWMVIWLTTQRHPTRADTFDVLHAGELDAQAITDRAIAWLDRHRTDRTALYLHYLDAHTPYRPPPDYARRFRDPAYAGPVGDAWGDVDGANAGRYDAADRAAIVALYDGAIRRVDDQLDRLLDHLRADGRLDRTLVVVTADHGEELWDHGRFFHGQSLYDELLHVPLIVRLPGAVAAGLVVDRQVRTLDIAPTLLEWAGVPAPETFTGRSLRAAMADPGGPPEDVVATAIVPQFPIRYAIRTPEWKLIDNVGAGTREAYRLSRDPAERRDRSADAGDALAPLAARLAAARAPLAASGVQVAVVGPAAGAVPFELRLEGDPPATFTTLDRTRGPGDTTLALERDGAALVVRGRADAGGRALRFDRLSPRWVAGTERHDPLRVALTVAGAPAPPGAVRLGPGGAPAADGRVDLLDRALVSPAPPPCPPPQAGVAVCLWRLPRELAAPRPAATDDATRERLRALGYLP